ncbi:hypothetical protein [Agromyces laixinhei]|uniref:hypothetical protein n=1 Tax=Agromyces laixinhei TaxID=2585717 RepID=UPI0011163DED|nr:hypothetical protein [Agromyces laixinhei]
MDDTRPATAEDVHDLAASMPHVVLSTGRLGNAVYQVGSTSFVFFRNPRPEVVIAAAAAEVGPSVETECTGRERLRIDELSADQLRADQVRADQLRADAARDLLLDGTLDFRIHAGRRGLAGAAGRSRDGSGAEARGRVRVARDPS